jgi:RNA polymerase sigma-70 factor (ECF subfamily)
MTSAAMGSRDGRSAPSGETGARGDYRGQDGAARGRGGFSDPRLLADAYARHSAAVYGVARQIAGTDAADGVTVDTFLALRRKPRSQGPAMDVQFVRAWLLAVAHRHAVRVLRSEPERRRQLARVAAAEVEQESWDRAGPAVRDLLSKLAADERRSVVLAYFGGHSCREISAILDRPESAVKSDLRTGLRRLREEAHRTGDGSLVDPAVGLDGDPGSAATRPAT